MYGSGEEKLGVSLDRSLHHTGERLCIVYVKVSNWPCASRGLMCLRLVSQEHRTIIGHELRDREPPRLNPRREDQAVGASI